MFGINFNMTKNSGRLVYIYNLYLEVRKEENVLINIQKHFCQVAISVKISNLFICFCNFKLFCPILEKDNFNENLYIVLLSSILFLTLFVSILFMVTRNQTHG